MLCKSCKKPIEITLSRISGQTASQDAPGCVQIGLKSFCSHECKKAYRRAYMAKLMQRKRAVSISGGYIDIDSRNVSTSNPHEKPIYEGKNGGLRLSQDNFESWGGKD